VASESDREQMLIESYLGRTLENDAPELIPCLKPDLKVLGVGCGTGVITMGVAEVVKPGDVVRIEPAENRVATGNDIARERGLDNVSFQVGNAQKLDFPDGTFDIVYSNTVLHHCVDPIGVLREQKRVTKPGGLVIAAGVRDWGLTPKYPVCPAVEKLYEGHVRYHQSPLTRYLSGRQVPGKAERQLTEHHYIDLHSARKCTGWFAAAGLTDVVTQASVLKFNRSNFGDAQLSVMFHVPPLDDPSDPLWDVYRDAIDEGYVDQAMIEEARRELATWFDTTDAFLCPFTLFAVGKA